MTAPTTPADAHPSTSPDDVPEACPLRAVWVVSPALRVREGTAVAAGYQPPTETLPGLARAGGGAAPLPTASGALPVPPDVTAAWSRLAAGVRPDAARATPPTGAVGVALAAARAVAIARLPWFAKAVLQLRPVLVPGYGTFGVTPGNVLLCDPALVLAWCYREGALDPQGVSVLANVLLHEAAHGYLDHAHRLPAVIDPTRGGAFPGYDAHHGNCAGDAEIHGMLFSSGCHTWPWEPVYGARYGIAQHGTAEWFYGALPATQTPPQRTGSHPGEARADDAPPGGATPGAPTADGQHACETRCGGGATGVPDPFEAEMDARYGATPAERASERGAVDAAIRAHAARNPGSVPGGILRRIADVRAPIPVPWASKVRAALRHTLDMATRGDARTYLRADRKQHGIGYGAGRPVLMGSATTDVPVWLAVDTSGSMSPDELAAGVAVVLGVLGTLRATVTLVAVDSAVQTMTRITAATPAAKIASYLRGGGGTDFRPLFAAATGDTAARRGHPAPRAVLVFTDGGACVPAEAPRGVEVLWVTGPTAATGGNHRRPCAWGQHVEVAV